MPNQDKWCFAWHFPRAGDEGKDRAALVKAHKWNSGDVITISFLDGDPALQEKVRQVAETWTSPQLARLNLDFRKNTTDTFIRISFAPGGSNSTIGTTCKQLTDLTMPTMRFGWLTPESNDLDIQSVVLHEFGHALGLIHEHQNPGSPIQWNKENVYRDLSQPPNSWSRETIDHNMFRPYEQAETNFTTVDPLSIMMYAFPASWTLDGFSADFNSKLSDQDKEFIHAQYP